MERAAGEHADHRVEGRGIDCIDGAVQVLHIAGKGSVGDFAVCREHGQPPFESFHRGQIARQFCPDRLLKVGQPLVAQRLAEPHDRRRAGFHLLSDFGGRGEGRKVAIIQDETGKRLLLWAKLVEGSSNAAFQRCDSRHGRHQ
jgi:hypothetical protein